MSHEEKSQRKKAMYSEEFQEMLDRIEEEDYVDRSGIMGMKKSRICLEKVKALEKHFDEENKLHPDRKIKIAEEVGLEPRQVAIWFQNRRARWKTKHLEREYDQLRASYDALKLDYGSLQQEKLALLNQLKELKARSDARSIESNPTQSISPSIQSNNVANDNTFMNIPITGSSSSSSSTRFDPFSMSSSSMSNEFQLCKAYQEQLMMMEELGMLNCSDASCNFFSSVDQAPTLHWQYGTNEFN
ncbi:hypothetical protein RND81_09G216000 [Saponaria officinalis]|uniref:Homeobox-leucine zipper protein n=1 Tax=Saponaria officinalis TaxID=3572 RepID=A0AAW1IPV8_SAPOF